ncbi:hypothetical protein KAR91_31330 [Candidatus Pacearchaeota archaeon]|nr:hypothetical protein [Candidatus Pacearchaeota archaeon]
MIIADLKDIDSYSITSEAAGYDFDNAVDAESSWLYWRSTSLVIQTMVLNFTGTINYFAIFGANFDQLTISGFPLLLNYDNLSASYRGFFDLGFDLSSPLTLKFPNQSVTEDYFTMSGMCIGNAINLCGAVFSYSKPAKRPVRRSTLFSGLPQTTLIGHRSRLISVKRNKNEHEQIEILNEFKRLVGKTKPFILYENPGINSRCYLCKRVDNHQISQNSLVNYSDDLIGKEI